MAMLAAHLTSRFGVDSKVTRSSAARIQLGKSDGNRRVEPDEKNLTVSGQQRGRGGGEAGGTGGQ